MYCPKCQSYMDKEANYCSHCGANLQSIIGLELFYNNNLQTVATLLRQNTIVASPVTQEECWLIAAKGRVAQQAVEQVFAGLLEDTGKKAKGHTVFKLQVWGTDRYGLIAIEKFLINAGFMTAVVIDAL